jgi:ureidoglycolate dehydrogenase (NAD+)
VTVRRSAHFGAAAFYARRAADAGLVAMAMTNTEPFVIPFGGSEPALGTNPIALAAPTTGGVFDLDMATSQVAVNRIFNARDEGRPIPLGWGVDARGEPTTDAAAVRSAVPLGGYKGYGLAVMVEILCGVLAGAGVRHGVGALYGDGGERQDTGHFHLALDPERTVGRERFAAVLGGMLDELRASPVAPGFDEVLVPGDPEARARAERERSGVPIEPALWAHLGELSAELGIPGPEPD